MKIKLPSMPLRLLLCGLLLIGSITIVTAQTGALEASEVQETETVQKTSLLKMVGAGGWAMYPLAMLSIAAFSLTVYNFMSLRDKEFFDADFAQDLSGKLSAVDIEGAKSICAENALPLARIINHGLESVRGGQVDTELFRQRLQAASSKELSKPFVIINYLSIIASISPMLGLLGTVSGMVKAFNSIATVGMGQPDMLAGNISEALITTATGMLVGIPTMFFFFYFKNQYGKLVADITLYMDDAYGDLVHGVRTSSSKSN